MSQYTSRINVRVSSPSIWNRFREADDAEFDLAQLADTKCTSFVIDGEWSCFESEMEGIVEALSETLGTEGIIIADTTNINVDPYEYCVYYFGGSVRTAYFGDYRGKFNMFFDTEISDIAGWLNYGKFSLSSKEKEQLMRCGVASYSSGSKVVYEEFSQTIEIKDRILLRKTSGEDKVAHVETLNLLDSVGLACGQATAEDSHIVEVFCKGICIGCLPSDAGEVLYPLLAANRLDYEARIIKLVPLSKRNKHANSPIIEIHIEAQKAYKPVKNNVAGANETVQIDNVGAASDFARSLARSLSDFPDSITFEGNIFVHTSCHQEKKIDEFVTSHGGEIKSSVVMKTNYLIIGNDIGYETTKVARARELIEQGKEICVITESDFWSFAKQGNPEKTTSTPSEKKQPVVAVEAEKEADLSIWSKYLSNTNEIASQFTKPTTSVTSNATQSNQKKADVDEQALVSDFGTETPQWQLYLAGVVNRSETVNLSNFVFQSAGNPITTTSHVATPSATASKSTQQKRDAELDEERLLREKKAAEENRKKAEEERILAEQRRVEEERRTLEEQQRQEEERIKKAEEERVLEEQRRAEEKRRKEEQEKQRLEEERRRAEEQKVLEEQRRIAEEQRKALLYKTAMEKFSSNDISVLNSALSDLQSISGWGEADQAIASFKEKIAYLLAEEKRIKEEKRQRELEQKRAEEQRRKEEMQRKWEEEEKRREAKLKEEEQKRIEAENQRKNGIYSSALSKVNSDDIAVLTQAISSLETISDWKDSKELIKKCREKMSALIAAEEMKQKEKLRSIRRENKLCQHCGGTFKGLFKKVCSQCGKPKDY